MSEYFQHIHFDMSREGLLLLSTILESSYETETPEVQNFINEIRSMTQKQEEEPSWLDV